MKVIDLIQEKWTETKDPTIRHAVTTYHLTDTESTNWAVFAGKRQIASGKTKEQANQMVNSQTLTKRFGKLTAKKQ